MSVYTTVSRQQLQQFLSQYPLGSLIEFSGIQAGIENSNYRITTTAGKFILTIFESLTISELPCYLSLLTHLDQRGFPSPNPQQGNDNGFIFSLNKKPAVLFKQLSGASIENPSIPQCTEMGVYLAKLHLYAATSGFYKENSMNVRGCQSIFESIKLRLADKDIALLRDELNFQLNINLPKLPKGVIHADLFKDNVLCEQQSISAVLDFYNACNDYFIFDIAVTCNDWCVDSGRGNQQKIDALISGYQTIRTLTDNEQSCLSIFLRLAALRFWLSRLTHQLNPKEGDLILIKDPQEFRHLLKSHRADAEVIA